MSTSCTKLESCRLCGKSDLELVLPVPATPPGDHYVPQNEINVLQDVYPLDIVLCRNCGLSQLAYTVNPDILYGRYTYVSTVSLGLVEHFKGYADEVIKRVIPGKGNLVVDIGSNDGSLLRAFQAQGMSVLGVDPAAEIARAATASGIETLNTYFSGDIAVKLKENYGSATIVTANNVMANVDDITIMLEGIRDLLTPDGVFVFETSYLLDVIEKCLIETVFHEHLSYFSVKPLESFFRKIGMELIHVQRVGTKGGSIRGTVQLAGGKRKISNSVAELITLENQAGLYSPETFKAYKAKLDRATHNLKALLQDLKTKGEIIAGYGASVGVTTLLYLLDLNDMLDFIVDDNPRKHNTFSPGHHIPVLTSAALYEKKPDYTVILAWAYAGQIMKKHGNYSEQGGHFIIPLPEVKVI